MIAGAIVRPFGVSAIGVHVTIAHVPFTFVDVLIGNKKARSVTFIHECSPITYYVLE